MKIVVEHEVPYYDARPNECVGPGDFFGNPVCKYHTHRDKTHGRKAPIERRVPKCILFDKWLTGEYQRCEECAEAVRKAMGLRNNG